MLNHVGLKLGITLMLLPAMGHSQESATTAVDNNISVSGAEQAGFVEENTEQELEFPDGVALGPVSNTQMLIDEVIAIMDQNGFLTSVAAVEGRIEGLRVQDDGRSEKLLVRFVREFEEKENVRVEWIYGQFTQVMLDKEPVRTVVGGESTELQQAIRDITALSQAN